MPKQTRKKRTGGVPARVVPKAPPPKSTKKKPRFVASRPQRAPQVVARMRCPMCNMVTDINDHITRGEVVPGFLNVNPRLRIYEQTFGGRLPAPRGLKPGQKSKEAYGIMSYKDVTDPQSAQYKEVVEVIRTRVGNINESLLTEHEEKKTKKKPTRKKTL